MSNLPDPKYIYHGSIQDGGDDLFVFAESGAVDEGCPDCERLYTADQMRDYAEEAVRLEREAILKMLDDNWYDSQNQISDAIRARSQEGQG